MQSVYINETTFIYTTIYDICVYRITTTTTATYQQQNNIFELNKPHTVLFVSKRIFPLVMFKTVTKRRI